MSSRSSISSSRCVRPASSPAAATSGGPGAEGAGGGEVPAISEAGGRVGTGEGAADHQGVSRRGGTDGSEDAGHAPMVRSAPPRRYRSVDRGRRGAIR